MRSFYEFCTLLLHNYFFIYNFSTLVVEAGPYCLDGLNHTALGETLQLLELNIRV